VTATSGPVQSLERRGFGLDGIRWWPATFSSVAACFLIAFALAAAMVAIFGAGIQALGWCCGGRGGGRSSCFGSPAAGALMPARAP
jgi:hypothetical protein